MKVEDRASSGQKRNVATAKDTKMSGCKTMKYTQLTFRKNNSSGGHRINYNQIRSINKSLLIQYSDLNIFVCH